MPDSPHILIVEDNADAATSLAQALTLSGARCEIASTLREALARLAAGGAGCVVLDLTLPDAQGVQAVERIQALYPEVPMVVLTGSPEMRVAALAAGAQELLTKGSATPEDVLRAAREAVVRHQARGVFAPLRAAVDAAVAKVERRIVVSDPDVSLPPGG